MTAKPGSIPLDDRRVESLLAEVRRIQDGLDVQPPGEILEAYRHLLGRAEAAGIRSVEVLYCAASAAHRTGDVAGGLEYILLAVALDPISPMLRRALEFHAGRAQAALAEKSREPDDESTPLLHGLLVRAGKADPRSHVALARHLAHGGRADEARELELDPPKLWVPMVGWAPWPCWKAKTAATSRDANASPHYTFHNASLCESARH